MASALLESSWKVFCLRGDGATAECPPPDVETVAFTSNRDLLALIKAKKGSVDCVLHAAALSDFIPVELEANGKSFKVAGEMKIPSQIRELRVTLHPAEKILPALRRLFPEAYLVGWKYEVNGGPDVAIQQGRLQIETCRTNACVVNGPAMGGQFAWLRRGVPAVVRFPDKASFASAIPFLLSEAIAN